MHFQERWNYWKGRLPTKRRSISEITLPVDSSVSVPVSGQLKYFVQSEWFISYCLLYVWPGNPNDKNLGVEFWDK
jgi:hypothetical protein